MVSRDVIPPEIKDYAPKRFCVVYTPRCVQVGRPALESESLTKPGAAPGASKPNSISTPTHSTGVRGVYLVFCLIWGLIM